MMLTHGDSQEEDKDWREGKSLGGKGGPSYGN